MTSRKEETPDLCNMDRYILDSLLRNLPLDKIWLDTFAERLRKLEHKKLVKRSGKLWSLTKLGRMLAVMQEGKLP